MVMECSAVTDHGVKVNGAVPEAFEATVFLCDIRGFTRLLERTAPAEGFRLVQKFLERLTAAVVEEGGRVNNLTGDGFLAQFGGGGADDSRHALRAVNCAIEMRARLQALNLQRHVVKDPTIAVGIGVHTGQVAGGTVRVGGYSSFLLIGDTVNVAARIESLTKIFAVDILLSAQTYARIRDRFTCLTMPPRPVKGKTDELATFWIPPHAKPFRTYDAPAL